jgi:hypothetical protein
MGPPAKSGLGFELSSDVIKLPFPRSIFKILLANLPGRGNVFEVSFSAELLCRPESQIFGIGEQRESEKATFRSFRQIR